MSAFRQHFILTRSQEKMSLNDEKVTFWDFEGVLFYLGILKILIVHYFDQLTRVFVKRIPQPEQALTQSP